MILYLPRSAKNLCVFQCEFLVDVFQKLQNISKFTFAILFNSVARSQALFKNIYNP
jgi:hypothetical protein